MSTIRPKKDAQTLNGNPISTSDPLTGDALVWDGAEWTPTAGGGGGGGVPLNFSQTKGAQVTITALEAKPATVVSTTITTAGNPVQIIVSGDANPSGGGWGLLNIYRDGTAVGQLVQFESSAANENVPYCLQVVDEPAAGTWTYSLKVTTITTDTEFGEAAGPIITVTELGAEAGGGGGSISGTIASAEIAFGTGVDTIGGSSNLTWNGNTVLVESPVDASGITVQDTGVTVITDIQSGAINMTSGFDEAYISGKDVLLRFRVDTAGGLIATIATLDETSVAAPLDLEIAELQINADPGTSGYVLTSNGAGAAPTWQASSGSGPAGGANEIQYNDGAGAFTASSNFTFDGATLNINSSAPSALTISSTIDGQFFDLNTSLYQLTLTDPTVAPTLVSTTIGPTDLAVFDGTSNQSGNVQAGLVGVFDNTMSNSLKMTIPLGVATIKSEDALFAPQALNLSIGELQVNTDPGTSGYALISNGAGAAPNWQAVVPASTSDYIIAIPGDDLVTKYGLAKVLTPGGNPLSTTNRAALIILPGNYVLTATLNLDTQFVDVVGLGGATKKPAVHISSNNIQADADDIRVSGLNMGTQAIFVGDSLTNQVFQNCTGGNGMFQASNEVAGTFIDCVGGDDSFTGAATVASGRFIRCDAGGGATGCFGFDASGYFEDCTATGDYAFGGFANSYGTFVRCTALGNVTFGALGIASGIYIDCKATGTDSFGSGGVANGTFTRCTATGAGSFGGGISGLALPSGCRGVFDHCVGGLNSFGDSAEGYAPAKRGISGQLYFCRATIGTFYNFRVLTAVCTPGTPASFDTSPEDHNYSVGTPVRFSTTGLMPTGALASKTYFVASIPTNSTFTLETYQGSGVGIDTTDAGTGTLTVTSGRLVHCVDGYNEPFTV